MHIIVRIFKELSYICERIINGAYINKKDNDIKYLIVEEYGYKEIS